MGVFGKVEDVVGDVVDGIGDVLHSAFKDLHRGTKKLKHKLHDASITSSKAACEDQIKHYIASKNYDATVMAENFKDCSSKDKTKILNNLQHQINRQDKIIKDLSADKTQKFCFFSDKSSKAQKIKIAEAKKSRIALLHQILSPTPIQAPTIKPPL